MARVRDVGRNPETSLVQSAAVANIKSQIKRNRQNDRRRVRNKAIRTELKTYTKKVRTAAAEGDDETAGSDLAVAIRQLDKAASKGVMHKRAAARKKSRLSRAVSSASSG
jgi:small subunit ribosomal protein S20